MRTDYDKILCERPRRGGKRGTRKGVKPSRYGEELPTTESMRFAHRANGDYKEFNDYLSPLFRWLRAQKGRPWAKVSSDMHTMVDSRKTTGAHVWQHLQYMVETNVYVDEEGSVRDCKDFRKLQGTTLYVDPRDGILKVVPGNRRRFKRDPKPETVKHPFSENGVVTTITEENGGYWEREYRWVKTRDDSDPLWRRPYTLASGIQTHVVTLANRGYGSNYVHNRVEVHWSLIEYRKRPLGKNEIRKLAA